MVMLRPFRPLQRLHGLLGQAAIAAWVVAALGFLPLQVQAAPPTAAVHRHGGEEPAASFKVVVRVVPPSVTTCVQAIQGGGDLALLQVGCSSTPEPNAPLEPDLIRVVIADQAGPVVTREDGTLLGEPPRVNPVEGLNNFYFAQMAHWMQGVLPDSLIRRMLRGDYIVVAGLRPGEIMFVF